VKIIDFPVSHPTSTATAIEPIGLYRLIEATTPSEVGNVILDLARSLPEVKAATLLWGSEVGAHPLGADATLDQAAWARCVLNGNGFCLARDGLQVALRLLPHEQAVLLLHFSSEQVAPSIRNVLDQHFSIAIQGLSQAMELASLQDSHKQLERSEALQRALFAIADLAGSDLDMPELLRGIHEIVSTLMYGENFFIVRHDPVRGVMRFLYFADVEDKQRPDTTKENLLSDLHLTLTWHLLTYGKPLMGNPEQLLEQVNGSLMKSGPDSVDWLGVPMLRNGRVHGALVVQSYREGVLYTLEDRAILEFVGSGLLPVSQTPSLGVMMKPEVVHVDKKNIQWRVQA
jgi:hypothetical protein